MYARTNFHTYVNVTRNHSVTSRVCAYRAHYQYADKPLLIK